jgi:hypothetical protein
MILKLCLQLKFYYPSDGSSLLLKHFWTHVYISYFKCYGPLHSSFNFLYLFWDTLRVVSWWLKAGTVESKQQQCGKQVSITTNEYPRAEELLDMVSFTQFCAKVIQQGPTGQARGQQFTVLGCIFSNCYIAMTSKQTLKLYVCCSCSHLECV